MGKKKGAQTHTPKDSKVKINRHTLINHEQIIIRDLRTNGRTGKSSQEFRDEYRIADVPKAVSKIRAKGYHIHRHLVDEADADGVMRKGIARYWLISEPKSEVTA